MSQWRDKQVGTLESGSLGIQMTGFHVALVLVMMYSWVIVMSVCMWWLYCDYSYGNQLC